MKRLLQVSAIAALSVHSITSSAQFQGKVYLEDSSIVVYNGTGQKTLAWCGGFEHAQFSVADLNNDGKPDLTIFERRPATVKTFINYGTAGNPDYRYRPQYAANFPSVNEYLVLKDFNGDNVPDLFHYGDQFSIGEPNFPYTGIGGTGYQVYRGYYNTSNELCFKYYKNLFYYNDKGAIGEINGFVNPGDIPSIIDVDKDGDLDFIAYAESGNTLFFNRNMQVESGLPADSIQIRLRDKCWGKVAQFYDREHELKHTCNNSLLTREIPSTGRVTHSGNTPCLLDMDGDGDYDYLDGNVSYNDMVYLRNGKIPYGTAVDTMVYQDTIWSSNGHTLYLPQWPMAFHCDIDMDGNRDIVATPNAIGENYRSVVYFRNEGTDAAPSFTFKSDTLLVEHAIDMGSQSYPVFYDFNKDGKLDMIVGSKGYYDYATGLYQSRLLYFENTSTTSAQSFTLISNDFLGMSAYKYSGVAPAVGDINNDGLDELILGHSDGTVHYVVNGAVSAAVQPDWTSSPAILKDVSATPVSTDGYAAPLVYDMNKDGHKDLLLGEVHGSVYYYQNMGTAPGPIHLELKTTTLGNIKVDPMNETIGNSVPCIGKIDNTGIEYLVLGSRSGRLFRYTGFQTGNVTLPYKLMDSAYSLIFNAKMDDPAYFSAPAIADLNGDGYYEMVLGNTFGGLHLYKQAIMLHINDVTVEKYKLEVFPNPAGNFLNVGVKETLIDRNAAVYIYNGMGQLVMTGSNFSDPQNIRVDIGALPPAVYLCVLHTGDKTYNAVFTRK